jgi:hypothetical protein
LPKCVYDEWFHTLLYDYWTIMHWTWYKAPDLQKKLNVTTDWNICVQDVYMQYVWSFKQFISLARKNITDYTKAPTFWLQGDKEQHRHMKLKITSNLLDWCFWIPQRKEMLRVITKAQLYGKYLTKYLSIFSAWYQSLNMV